MILQSVPQDLDTLIDEMLAQYTGIVPMEMLATFVFAAFAIASSVRTQSPIIPMGFVMLAGGSILPMIAPIGVQAAAILVLTVGAGAMALAWRAYSR